MVINDAMVAHVLPGENGGAAGAAEGSGHEGIFEMGALGGHAIEIGGLRGVGSLGVAGEEIVAIIVGEDDDNVGPLRGKS